MVARVFKVTTPDRVSRSLASGFTLEELISDACTNLDIEFNSSCKLVLEDDGTSIQKYKLLENLAEAYPNAPLLLMVVYEGAQWRPVNENIPVTSYSTAVEEENQRFRPNSVTNEETAHNSSTNHVSSPTSNLSALPWDYIVPKKLKNIETNPACYIIDLIRNASEYMKDVLHDETFGTAKRIAELIVSKYPKVFAFSTWKHDKDDNESTLKYSTGVKSLQKRIYDRIRNANYPENKRKRNDDSDEDEPLPKITRYDKNKDSYGCVAYEPPLPENETAESQSNYKEALLLSLTHPECKLSVEEEDCFLNCTYSSQRICLNRREQLQLSLDDILKNHWSHLKQEKHFLSHASTLIGRDMSEQWTSSIENKVPTIYEFFRDYCRKYKTHKNLPVIAQKVATELQIIKTTCNTLESQLPKTIGILPLLSGYFKEDSLFILVDADSTEEQMKASVDSTRPILIIKGTNIYQESCSCVVMVEKTILIETDNVLRGVLFLILSHYVYGYNYDANKSSTFEFIQRMLLEIDPQKGSKGQRKKKHQKLTQEASKAVKLINKVVKHQQSNEW